jgi:hypothetical protein
MDIPGPCPRCVESQRRRRNPAKGRNGAQRLFGIWCPAGRPRSGAEVEGVGFAGRRTSPPKTPLPLSRSTPGTRLPDRPEASVEAEGRLDSSRSPAAWGRKRDIAMFNLAIDSKLRDCHLIRVSIDDVCAGGRVRDRATVVQTKTQLAGSIRIAQAIVWDGVWQRASWRSVAPAADSNNGSTPWS